MKVLGTIQIIAFSHDENLACEHELNLFFLINLAEQKKNYSIYVHMLDLHH
jgi:hypothetical protein